MGDGFLWLVGVVVCVWVVSVEGARPEYQAEGSSLWIVNNTVLNSQFVMGTASLEFDQELYVNGPTTACAHRDRSCDPLTCTPCDWAIQDPDTCLDSDCCWPGDDPATTEELEAWCSDDYEYTTLEFGDSDSFEIAQKEWRYHRFFLPESLYCRSVIVTLRSYFGIVSMVLSSSIPEPDFEAYDLAVGGPAPGLGMAVTTMTLCPTAHKGYTTGTYSIGVYGLTPAAYRIDLEYAEETQPFPQPSDRQLCSDVPASEFARRGASGEPVICMEDGETQTVTSDMASSTVTNQVQIIVPLNPGCQKISIFGLADSETLEAVSFAIHCLSPVGSGTTRYGNTLFTRFGARRDQAVSFNLCFQEVTYLTCAFRFYTSGSIEAVFSTEAETKMRRIVDLPHSSVSFMDTLGGAIVAPFGGRAWACGDLYVANYNWLGYPTTDPLVLFPANANLRYFYYDNDLLQEYMDAGLGEPVANKLIVAFAMNVGNAKMMSYNTSFLSLSVLGITNKDGEIVSLPNDGMDLNPPTVEPQALASRYTPNIALSSIPEFDPTPLCDSDKYEKFEKLVQSKIDNLLDDSLSFDEILYNKYAIDLFNSGIAGSSCNSKIAERIQSRPRDVSILDQIACLLDPVLQEFQWLFEACCNPFLELQSCCLPYTLNTTLVQYTDDYDAEGCGVPECAETYLDELGYAFNNLDDRVLGCSSGIQEFPLALKSLEIVELNKFVVPCMEQSGFGESFDGPSCTEDSDCTQWTGRCNLETNTCALDNLEEMENNFLTCFINTMSTSLEDYIRAQAVIKNSVPRDSQEFFDAVKEAASITDCINPNNPIDLRKRERYEWDVQRLLCKADFLGVSPDDTDTMDELCPPGLCLGDFCLQNNSDCRARCDLAYIFTPLVEDECAEEACVADSGCDDTYQCMYCPPNEDECTVVTSITDQTTCESSVACVLPSGEVVFDLTATECSNVGYCSGDCVGPSCVSFDGIEGVCAFDTDLTTCTNFGTTTSETVEFDITTCLVTSVTSETDCDSYVSTEPTIAWYTCSDFEATCGTENITFGGMETQRYMNCYESMWKVCETQTECESEGGYCSDRPYAISIHSYDYPIVPQIGGCFTGGEYFGTLVPHCNPSETYFGAGCHNTRVFTPETCTFYTGNLIPQQWVTPATTQDECQSISRGRYGCLLPSPLNQLLWILNEPECECWSGTNHYAWDWTPGTWDSGVSRSLEWRLAESETMYELQEDRLSFIVISEWVQGNVLEQFLDILRSEALCTSNSITFPMFTLVCDCQSDDKGSECYTFANDKEVLMGFSYACADEESSIKSPSGHVNFDVNSVYQGCTDVNISIIYKNWYRAPFIPPPISFEWEEPEEIGPVINHHKSTVGLLVGDGTKLSFGDEGHLRKFEICLLFSPPDDRSNKYRFKDFGYIPNLDSEFIYPLGLNNIYIERRSDSVFFCARVDFRTVPTDVDNEIYLFPILRVDDWEDVDDEYVSRQTRALMYTLGVCYSLLIPTLFLNVYQYFAYSKRGGAPLSLWMAYTFICLCIFRAVFMFAYPNAVFEGNSLAEFVVFEIPTFLLLSVVIICIYYWKKVVIKKNHFIPEKSNRCIIYLGLGFVWSLWLIVTLVYSEVILEEGGQSVCGGRVATDYSEVEDNTRTLAIVYHSVIIAITLILSFIFLYYTYTILSASKSRRMTGAKQYVVVIGGIICCAFILRSILFLVVLAIELASSIYLFVTLFLTEVLMIAITQVQFLKKRITDTASRFSRSSARKTGAVSERQTSSNSIHYESSSSGSSARGTQPQYDME